MHNSREQGNALATLLIGDYSPADGRDEVVHLYMLEEDSIKLMEGSSTDIKFQKVVRVLK